jgi:glutathione peroxidase|mmetsp:Transcript_81338/g.136129  ORF Transcript_81338/g.136129 Transcript_81338/m.136129 type:complete len:111 (+) Transcript_81338:436-768(+)
MVAMYDRLNRKGFQILAFPCNQFLGQEPGTNAQIKSFAAGYGAKFQLFDKIDVNGPNESEVYSYLKSKFPGPVPWNFGAKFIVGKDGVPVKRYAAGDNWGEIEQEVTKLL